MRKEHHKHNEERLIKPEMVTFKAVRSSKPGGMNVDHRATKIHASVSLKDLQLEPHKIKLIRQKLDHHINNRDELWVESEETRSQEMNKDMAVDHLNTMVQAALIEPPPRIENEPPLSAEDERIAEKKIQSEKKQIRRKGRLPHGNP